MPSAADGVSVASCLRSSGYGGCSRPCKDHRYPLSCLKTALPLWTPFAHTRCCFRCCVQQWMSQSALGANEAHWMNFAQHGGGINESTRVWMPWYVQPHDKGEVLLGDMSAALLSHGNVIGMPGLRTTLQFVRQTGPMVQHARLADRATAINTSMAPPMVLHSNSVSGVSLLLRRARELSARFALTLISRDDVRIPNDAARRAWREVILASQRAGIRRPTWYVQNVAHAEPGVRPFPIGVAQPNELAAFLERAGGLEARVAQRDTLLACGLMQLDLPSRKRAVATMKRNGFECDNARDADLVLAKRVAGTATLSPQRLRAWLYYSALTRTKFVLSPEGHGRDCFRTWEALALGAIPVLRVVPNASEMDAAKFAGLPIVWVHRWKEVTRSLLVRRWQELRSDPQKFSASGAFFPHWLAEILGDRT